VKRILLAVGLVVLVAAGRPVAPRVVPGITVLLEDSLGLVEGKRIALLTNQTGIDEHGVSDIDRLAHAPRVRLVALCSPEHGIRGTVDRQFVANGTDSATGLPIYSLYGAAAVAPPDSLLARIDVLVIDLQDVGTRTWTYVGSMLYALQAAARMHVTVVVLDRPNPITGSRVEGPLLDSALPPRAYALYPMPLRHGLTMGELAAFFNGVLALHADLHVVPARGWRRDTWFEQTGLPWVRPSPNLPTLTSVLLYPALVPFEGSNVSVGRGTPQAFQQLGAPWLDAPLTVGALRGLALPGVRFTVDTLRRCRRRTASILDARFRRCASPSPIVTASMLDGWVRRSCGQLPGREAILSSWTPLRSIFDSGAGLCGVHSCRAPTPTGWRTTRWRVRAHLPCERDATGSTTEREASF
jgi:uncharacterized protein YbbC (DUF1343 family)